VFKRIGLSVIRGLSPILFGVPFLLASIFISVALFSYHKDDPSFDKATSGYVHNVTGEYGAFIADPMLQSLGLASILPVLFFAVFGIKILLRKKIKFVPIRVALLLVTTPIFAGTLAFLGHDHSFVTNGYGGFIGSFVKNEMSLRFDEDIIFWPSIVFIILGSIGALSLTLGELKKVSIFSARQLIIIGYITIWFCKFSYYSVYRLIAKFSGVRTEDEVYPDLTKPKALVEIVSKTPKVEETKARVQSKLLLDPEDFLLPATSLLKAVPEKNKSHVINEAALSQNSKILQKVLEDFGIKGEVIKIHPGPVVTLYEFEPAAGIKSSRIIGLADDISRSMSAISARIAVIPGKSSLGIELPNAHREVVYLRELLETKAYQSLEDKLPLILGKNIAGEVVIADLSKMPHLLVAGTTGSGKSVAINTMILSLLYKYSPKQCKFIMIDPKMLELSVYDGIPHLLTPVVTEPKKAVAALKWVVKEMESRYRNMSTLGVRNLDGYNKALAEALRNGTKLEKTVQVGFNPENGEPIFETISMDTNPLPFIVVIVDEMADLMLVAGKDIEGSIQRLAQMARAAGIHLIMATQRPSVDVITGVIKANFPTRISFQVTSKIDSRTILGEQGAEQLLGMGDMLHMRGGGRIERVHGPFVDDKEVESIASFLKTQGSPTYIESVTIVEDEDDEGFGIESSGDDMYDQAVAIVLKERKASTSYIQRCLRIGYNRAANLIEKMEKEGIVSAPNHTGKREILVGEN
jgi:DNA segregation ATPase FtsK/SpoIIIE, S-DNA-T family